MIVVAREGNLGMAVVGCINAETIVEMGDGRYMVLECITTTMATEGRFTNTSGMKISTADAGI